MLQLRARVDRGAMAIKGYSAFPKIPTLLETHHQIFSVIPKNSLGGVLLLCKEAEGVFYSLNLLGHMTLVMGVGFYSSAKKQSVYSTASTYWVTGHLLWEWGFTPQQRSSWCICREEENLVFCFGAQFNSTLYFTQSG